MVEASLKEGTYGPQNAKLRVRRAPARQSGRVARRQLTWLGATDSQSQLGARRFITGACRVYAVGHAAPSLTTELSAALLYAGPNAMLVARPCAAGCAMANITARPMSSAGSASVEPRS